MTKFGKKRNAIRDSLVGKNKHNPFEIHINNLKFKILGQKSKDDRGIPGVSRTKAIKKRENSLLNEYKNRFKSGKFIDKRIGENDPFMDPERKMMLRMIAEKRHEFSKKNIFNLNDEVELTHKGEHLTDATLNDRSTFSDEDDDEDMLDANYVKQQHFGGGFLTKKNPESEEKPKSRKEWIEEIIAESKRKKSETKKEKEEQDEAVTRLNSQYQNFMMHMSGNRMTDEDKEKSVKNCEFKSYDQIVKEQLFDRTRRAQPTDRSKTEAEIAKEQKEKLEVLEAARLRRMEINFDENAPKGMIQQSADALDDEYYYKKDTRFHVSYKDGAMLPDSPISQTSPSKVKNVIEAEEPSEKINDKLTESKELPYTFEVPPDYDSFWNLLQGRNPQEFAVILDRMFSCNHPRLGVEKKNKCTILFAYLLQTLHMICSVDPELIHDSYSSLEYIDPMIPYMFKLTSLSPHDCAVSINQVIEEKYHDYKKNGNIYPFADTFIFLKVSGLLFPASDYHHEVMTRVATILTQILGECKVRNRRDVTCLLFTAALLYEYLKRCGRFIGELSNALRAILYMCVPSDQSKLLLQYTTPFQRVGPKADLLVLKDKVEKYEPQKLSLSQLNEEDTEMTEEFKVCAVHESLRILTSLTKTWANLPSARTLSSLVSKILVKFPIHNYPEETKLLVQQLEKQIEELPPHPRHLVKRSGAVKSLRMLEPKFEKIVEGFKKRRGTKEHQEIQKLEHKLKRENKGAKRELRRDAAFLGNEQLKETLRSDAERKRKVNLIMQGLSCQESDFKKMKNKKRFQ